MASTRLAGDCGDAEIAALLPNSLGDTYRAIDALDKLTRPFVA
jgi:hypothetical protein